MFARTLSRLDPFSSFPEFTEEAPAPERSHGLYRRFLSIHEIEASAPLRWLGWALLLSYFVTFNEWARATDITVETARAGDHMCWPFFTSCGEYYFLSALPRAYSQTTFYAGLFVLMGLCAFAMWRDRWRLAHATMLVLFTWKMLVVFVLTTRYAANFHYFHLIFSFFFLFAPHKLFFLRRTFVLLYMLAGVIKLNDGWIAGTYFSSLAAGLPLVPDPAIPIATNLVIALEVVGSGFLLSQNRVVQRFTLLLFVLFHAYSAVLVMYRYPTMVLGPLLALFGPTVRSRPLPMTLRALPALALWCLLVGGQSIAYAIPGDSRLTLEGNYFGLFMFEANHQCRSAVRVRNEDGSKGRTITTDRTHAHHRCDPYNAWFRAQQLCKQSNVDSVQWTFDHSVNGGPFLRIVDEDDACAVTYRPFAHNPWIRTESDAAQVGRPVQNIY